MSSLAIELACAADPVTFARHRLRNADGDPIIPDPWQERVLRSRERQMIANCCRRSGKSTMAAVMAAHTAVYSPASTTLIVSRGQDQAKELFATVSGFLKSHPCMPNMEADSMTRCTLSNNSRVISLANGDAVRGYTPQLIIIDEAAFVDDRTHKAIRPMLAHLIHRGDRMPRVGNLCRNSNAIGRASPLLAWPRFRPSLGRRWGLMSVGFAGAHAPFVTP